MDQNSQHIDLLPPFLQERLAQLVGLCQKHSLRYLYAVGSVLRPEKFRPDSDVDFLFALDETNILDEQYNPNLWAFWHALEALFDRKVDLIHGPSLKNPYFIEELNETKRLIYDQKSQKVPMGHRP